MLSQIASSFAEATADRSCAHSLQRRAGAMTGTASVLIGEVNLWHSYIINMEQNGKNVVSFFFGDFHSGAVNVFFHCLGFAVLGYGLGVGNVIIITASTFIMETGHFYNVLRGRGREFAFLAIPVQWIFWMIIVWGGYAADQLIRSKN